MHKPLVSICCSVLNQKEQFLGMVASIQKQTYENWELVVVDDGSTEDIAEICALINQGKFEGKVRFTRFEENRGIPFGINEAFRQAKGKYVFPIACDERIAPMKLEAAVEIMEEKPELEIVFGLPGQGEFGDRSIFEQNALQAHNRTNAQWVKTLLNLENVPIGGVTGLWRRDVFDRIGYFDEKLTIFSDHEWFTRFFASGGKALVVPIRWQSSVEAEETVRSRNMDKVNQELDYVRTKHKLEPPVVGGEHGITVGIACYNMAHWITETIQSVLAQQLPVTEILVYDDASTEGDLESVLNAIGDPRIKYFRGAENMGNMAAQNFMITQATGAFYFPIGADDTIDPTFTSECMLEFAKDPWLEFVASQTDFMDEEGKPITKDRVGENPFYQALNIRQPVNAPREQWMTRLHHGNEYFGIGMYRTETLRNVGGWKRQYGVIADYEMYLALLQRYRLQVVEKALTHTRLHGKNISNMGTSKPSRDGKTLAQLYKEVKANYYPHRMKVIIATPFYEMRGFSPYISSLTYTTKLLSNLGIAWEFWELSGDSYVHRARNTICARFLEDEDATDLFFIDSDMSWNPDAFVRMLLLPEEIVGGSYPTKNQWDNWTSNPVLREEDGKFFPVGRQLQDGSALIVADTLAAGFLRIKRSALERFQKHYKDEHVYKEPCADSSNPDRLYTEFFACMVLDKTMYGEDRTFCLRMKEAGIDLHLYPNINFGHYGIKGWTGNFDKFLRGGKKSEGDETTKEQIRAIQ